MPYIDPEVVQKAKEMDLLTYLQNYEPDELVRISGNVYSARSHGSLKISNNGLWMWWARGIGGKNAIDYLMKVRDMSFPDAVKQIMGYAAVQPPVFVPSEKEKPRVFVLPKPDTSTAEVARYLARRRIGDEIISHCIKARLLYQSRYKGYANVVFVGYDAGRNPRYATVRGTCGSFKGDVAGSNKRFSFTFGSGGKDLHLFESAVDALSFATLEGIQNPNAFDGCLLSLSGVYKPRANITESTLPPALSQHLDSHSGVRAIHLHLDNDVAGREATEAIMAVLPKEYASYDKPPPTGYKDYNDYLCGRSGQLLARPGEREPIR
jgi:hypothetical protein